MGSEWDAAGFAPAERDVWMAQGFTDPALAARWRNAGVPAESAADWRTRGFLEPGEVPLSKQGLTVETGEFL